MQSVTVRVAVHLSDLLYPIAESLSLSWRVEPGGLRQRTSVGSWRSLSGMETAKCQSHPAGNSHAPDSPHLSGAVGGWDPRDCRCPFPVEGLQARVAGGGNELRPFRRVTAAESRRLSHPGRPSLPGPERPGPGQPREREMPPVMPLARNWGHSAAVPAAPSWGHRCPDLPGLVGRFPDGRAPTPRAQP